MSRRKTGGKNLHQARLEKKLMVEHDDLAVIIGKRVLPVDGRQLLLDPVVGSVEELAQAVFGENSYRQRRPAAA